MSDATVGSGAFVRHLNAGLHSPLVRAVVSGIFVGFISLLFYLSYAALIFSGPLSPWLAYGLAATFITGAIGGAVTALGSSLPFTIGGPDGSTSAVTAALVGTLVAKLGASGAPDHLLIATLLLLALTAAASGILLLALGYGGLGRAIRFIPYPVIGGFLGASGCLMLMGVFKLLTGYPASFSNLEHIFETDSAEKLLAGLAVGVFLIMGRKIWKSPLASPAQLLVCGIVFYIAMYALDVPLGVARAQGWTFAVPGAAPYTPPWKLEFVHFPWKLLPEIGADIIAVMFVTTISVLLNVTSVEISTRREADLDLELKAQGCANLLSAMFGGLIGCVTSSRSKLNFDLGSNSRLAGVIAASLSLVALLINPAVLAYIPKCVLAGLLISIGYDYVARWLFGTARQIAKLEYASLLAIAFIIVAWGFLPGVAIGVIFGCAAFAFSAGRINVIKLSFDGSEYRSSLDRGPRELSVLAEHGGQLQGLRLQSYLFFGSANRLYEHVKALLASRPDCRFLLFDFRLVTGIDSSAVHSFTQIKQAADAIGARLVMVNMPPPLEKIFHNSRFMSKDIMVTPELDRALEICENAIISDHAASTVEVRSLRDWLTEALGSVEMAERLAQDCHRMEFAPGDVVAHQGAAADSMHFIIDGRVGILVDFGDGLSVRVRSLGRQTTIGEMGLLTGRPRSATVQAEVASIIYELPAPAFARLKLEEPALVQALLSYVIGVMAERLSFASRVIGVLQR